MKSNNACQQTLVLLSFGILLIQSCFSPDCGTYTETEYNLDQHDTIKIPYSGYDTILFVNHLNDTFISIGKGKIRTFSTEPTTGDPDCGFNSDKFNGYYIDFRTTNKANVFGYYFSQKKIKHSSEIKIEVNKILYTFNPDYAKWKFDSLFVNNKMYYRVIEVKAQTDLRNYYPESYVMEYCPDYGLIQISGSTNGILWSRLEN